MEQPGSGKYATGLIGHRTRRVLILPAILFVLFSPIAVLKTVSAWQGSGSSTGERTGARIGLGDVHALARLEPAAGLIVVGARPGARIERILIAQGDTVSAGQVVAIMEGHDQAQVQVALAGGKKKQVNHERSLKKQKLTLERDQFDRLQKAKLDSASRVFSSRQRFDLIGSLHKQLIGDKNLSPKDRFDIELRYFEAESQNLRGELEVKSFEIAQQLTPKQRALENEELADSNPDLEILDRQIDLARANLAQTEVRSPVGGQILELLAHAGEVSGGPLLEMGDLSTIVATAEVYQSDVPRLRLGDPASIAILDQTVGGKVSRIGSMVGKNQLTSLDPRALQDRRVVKVTITLDDPKPAQRLVNMEVDVAIKPGGGTATSPSPTATGE
jgi:HlyD family secretion protein